MEILDQEVAEKENKNPLNTVTPLGKFLAMFVFLLLPFIGGYIGYNYAPGKVVEVEKISLTQTPQMFDAVESITWNTWFGHCVGYCSSELVVRSDAIFTRSEGWDPEFEPPIHNMYDHTDAEFQQLLVNVDTQAFLTLPERIGCPDCADQGGESIKIGFGNGVFKEVSYSYGKAPDELNALTTDLIELGNALAIKRLGERSCNVDSDCMLVQPDCEDCTFDAINKNDLFTFSTEKNNRCELNPPLSQCDITFSGEAKCINNTCQITD